MLRSTLRWIGHNLAPTSCPDCAGLLSLHLNRTPRQLGAILRPDDLRGERPSDWLCCERCPYALALDLDALE